MKTMKETEATSKDGDAAAAQHAMLGIEEEREQYERTTHPGAQWFGAAGLGLSIHWGVSRE